MDRLFLAVFFLSPHCFYCFFLFFFLLISLLVTLLITYCFRLVFFLFLIIFPHLFTVSSLVSTAFLLQLPYCFSYGFLTIFFLFPCGFPTVLLGTLLLAVPCLSTLLILEQAPSCVSPSALGDHPLAFLAATTRTKDNHPSCFQDWFHSKAHP